MVKQLEVDTDENCDTWGEVDDISPRKFYFWLAAYILTVVSFVIIAIIFF